MVQLHFPRKAIVVVCTSALVVFTKGQTWRKLVHKHNCYVQKTPASSFLQESFAASPDKNSACTRITVLLNFSLLSYCFKNTM